MEQRLVRILRTLTSEIYLVWQGERRIGQIDLHYAGPIIQATLVLEPDLSEEDEAALVRQIDHQIVTSYMHDIEREDFLVTVYRGTETQSYSDPLSEDDEDLPDIDWE
ncbi:MAG: hypothetical protein ACE5O2_11965 [Armatimonadota bacterium]